VLVTPAAKSLQNRTTLWGDTELALAQHSRYRVVRHGASLSEGVVGKYVDGQHR
jgi:hypothetical protein